MVEPIARVHSNNKDAVLNQKTTSAIHKATSKGSLKPMWQPNIAKYQDNIIRTQKSKEGHVRRLAWFARKWTSSGPDMNGLLA